MKMNLTEIVNLKVTMTRKLEQLKRERDKDMYVTVEKDETPELDGSLVEITTSKIIQTIKDIAEVEAILQRENSKEREYGQTITGMISYIKRMREELNIYQTMAVSKAKAPQSSYASNSLIRYSNFVIDDWKRRAEYLEQEINTISRQLDRMNFTTEVEVPMAERYI